MNRKTMAVVLALIFGAVLLSACNGGDVVGDDDDKVPVDIPTDIAWVVGDDEIRINGWELNQFIKNNADLPEELILHGCGGVGAGWSDFTKHCDYPNNLKDR